MKAPREISLHIDRLVIEGIPLDGRQAARLQVAVQSELKRLLEYSSERVPTASAAYAAATGTPLKFASNTGADALGRKIARNLHEVISRQL